MNLTSARLAAGFSIRKLAKQVGCSAGHLSEIESGKKSASIGLARRLKAALPKLNIETLDAHHEGAMSA